MRRSVEFIGRCPSGPSGPIHLAARGALVLAVALGAPAAHAQDDTVTAPPDVLPSVGPMPAPPPPVPGLYELVDFPSSEPASPLSPGPIDTPDVPALPAPERPAPSPSAPTERAPPVPGDDDAQALPEEPEPIEEAEPPGPSVAPEPADDGAPAPTAPEAPAPIDTAGPDAIVTQVEDFDTPPSLARFSRPARTVRVTDTTATLSAAAVDTVGEPRRGGALSLRRDEPFRSVSTTLQLAPDALATGPEGLAAIRVGARVIDSIDENGVASSVRASLLLGDRGAGPILHAQLREASEGPARLLSESVLADGPSLAALGESFEVGIEFDGERTVTFRAGSFATTLETPEGGSDASVDLLLATELGGRSTEISRAAVRIGDLVVNGAAAGTLRHALRPLFAGEGSNVSVDVADGRAVLSAASPDGFERVARLATREDDEERAAVRVETTLAIEPVTSGSDAEPALAPEAATLGRLEAVLYNDTYEGDWNLFEGDVIAAIDLLRRADGALRAVARLVRVTDADGGERETLFERALPTALGAGDDHRLGIVRDGATIVFSVDADSLEWTIATDAFAPWSTVVAIEARAGDAAGDAVTLRVEALAVERPVPAVVPSTPVPAMAPTMPSVPVAPPSSTLPAHGSRPTAPDTLYGLAYSPTALELSWSRASGMPPLTYEIARDGRAVRVLDGASFTDTDLTPGTTYDYRVTTIDGRGVRAASAATARVATKPRADIPPIVERAERVD